MARCTQRFVQIKPVRPLSSDNKHVIQVNPDENSICRGLKPANTVILTLGHAQALCRILEGTPVSWGKIQPSQSVLYADRIAPSA